MDKKFLLDYLKTDSPSTFEKEGQMLWMEKIKPYVDEVNIDNYGNVMALIRGTDSNFKVLLDAHGDEIGWVVKSITKDGFIKVCRNGGTDNDLSPATQVRIMTESGEKIKGFFGWIPIHLKDRNKPEKPDEEKLFIDVGATSDEEVEALGIEVGNFIVVDREPEILNDKYVVGKSIDDKIGGFIHVELAKKLLENNIKLPYDLYIVNSVQEEVGLYGANLVSQQINADVVICFDVTFDTNTPLINKNKEGDFKIGEGIVFRQGKDVHNNLLKLMKNVAKESNIPYKVAVGAGGGTNTMRYFMKNAVTGTLSIPLRYMHTPNELVCLEDAEYAVKFYESLLRKLTHNNNFKYFG